MKHNGSQGFPDPNSEDQPEGVDWSWTSESQDERTQHELNERNKIRPMSDEEQSVENSRRSRWEK